MKAVAGALVLLTGACGNDLRAPIDVPERLDAVEVGDCDIVGLTVENPPLAPIPAKNIVVRCEDPAICSAEVGDHGDVVVRAKAPGATLVQVAFVHPVTGARVLRRVPVTVFDHPRGADMLHPRMKYGSACPR